jgi:hypothetical protein
MDDPSPSIDTPQEAPADTAAAEVTPSENAETPPAAVEAGANKVEAESTAESTFTPIDDDIQPFIEQVKETIKLALNEAELNEFLRAKIKKSEEWADWSDNAKRTFSHMMAAQLLQRKATALRASVSKDFVVPQNQAYGQMLNSLNRTHTKPVARRLTSS